MEEEDNDTIYKETYLEKEEIEHVKKAWEELKGSLSFKIKHKACIKELKQFRLKAAHPSFDRQKMESALETLPADMKRTGKELLDMYTKLEMMLQQSR